jgi:hypothetical protein
MLEMGFVGGFDYLLEDWVDRGGGVSTERVYCADEG